MKRINIFAIAAILVMACTPEDKNTGGVTYPDTPYGSDEMKLEIPAGSLSAGDISSSMNGNITGMDFTGDKSVIIEHSVKYSDGVEDTSNEIGHYEKNGEKREVSAFGKKFSVEVATFKSGTKVLLKITSAEGKVKETECTLVGRMDATPVVKNLCRSWKIDATSISAKKGSGPEVGSKYSGCDINAILKDLAENKNVNLNYDPRSYYMPVSSIIISRSGSYAVTFAQAPALVGTWNDSKLGKGIFSFKWNANIQPNILLDGDAEYSFDKATNKLSLTTKGSVNGYDVTVTFTLSAQ